MTVLFIIGTCILVGLVWLLVASIDRYSYMCYKYKFFSWSNFILIFFSNLSLAFGYKWYTNAQIEGGDLLNGEILIFLGAAGLLCIIYQNFKYTSFSLGLFGSFVQMVVFAMLSVFFFIAILFVIALLFETKPVYNINND
ncbi:MAG: hypothetical protein PHW07_04920 [Sulfurospirillaceae bacterium]|nr:hypothetical protein [Sulfurospirillaceae bacterium]